MKNNISLLVGLKNNLDYNKHFYETTRELYPGVEICFVSYGSTDGTHDWLDSLNDDYIKYFYSRENKTFAETFNKAAELATNEYVAYLHNDIVLAPGFLENLIKYLDEQTVVSYTTIEPPIFSDHARPGKIIQDFGTTIESFELDKFREFVIGAQSMYQDMNEFGITFFMAMHRHTLLDIGGLDNLFNPMFCEDDDLILRYKLLNFKLITSLDSICYHFVSKTSRFSDEYQNKTSLIENYSNENFIRKWGFRRSNYLVRYKKYFIVTNVNDLLPILEPWADKIYIDMTSNISIEQYVYQQQPNTKFDLTKRISYIQDEISDKGIIVYIDGKTFNDQDWAVIQNLSDIVKDSGDIGEFSIGNLKVVINDLTEYQNTLIKIQ